MEGGPPPPLASAASQRNVKIKSAYGSSPFLLQPMKSKTSLPALPSAAPPSHACKQREYPKYKSGIGAMPAASSAAFSYTRDISLLDKLYCREGSWLLGEGFNGSVSTCTKRETGVFYALKTMLPADGETVHSALPRLLEDVEMQRSLDHPNILRILDVFVDRRSGEVSFVMPLCPGGTVAQHLERHPHISEADKAALVRKMLSAIHYCHSRGIMHRDIKLENFVFDSELEDAELKLIDFGLATRCRPGEETQHVAFTTLLYTAPEMHWIWHRELVKSGRRDPRRDVSCTAASRAEPHRAPCLHSPVPRDPFSPPPMPTCLLCSA